MSSDVSMNSDVSVDGSSARPDSNIEAEKLSLERDKFEFEKTKFNAEEAKRRKEIDKLDEEIRELRRPLWRKSSSIGAVATITVALVAGGITFGTNLFKSDIHTLIADRTRLQRAVDGLGKEERTLKHDAAQLQQQTDELKRENDGLQKSRVELISQRDSLITNTTSLRAQKTALQEDVLLAPIRTRIGLLEAPNSQSVFELGNGSLPSDESINFLRDFASSHHSDPRVKQVFQQSFDAAKGNPAKAVIALALFELTGDPAWKGKIIKLASDDIRPPGYSLVGSFAPLPYYLRLLKQPGLLSSRDKVRLLQDLYLEVTKIVPASTANAEINYLKDENARSLRDQNVCALAKWDKTATVSYRLPWIECKNQLISKLRLNLSVDSEHRGSSFELFEFSKEVFGIAFLEGITSLGPSRFQDGEKVEGPFLPGDTKECPAFDQSFPLCKDWNLDKEFGQKKDDVFPSFRIWQASFPSYKEWLEKNSQLTAALIYPSDKTLFSISDDSMDKLFDGVWITAADLHH